MDNISVRNLVLKIVGQATLCSAGSKTFPYAKAKSNLSLKDLKTGSITASRRVDRKFQILISRQQKNKIKKKKKRKNTEVPLYIGLTEQRPQHKIPPTCG